MGNAESNAGGSTLANAVAGSYTQQNEYEIRNANNRNFLLELLDPQHNQRLALKGASRPGLVSATLQNGGTPEEIYSKVAELYHAGDPQARKFVDDNRMHPMMGTYSGSRGLFPRPWPSQFHQPHYNPQHPRASPSIRAGVSSSNSRRSAF